MSSTSFLVRPNIVFKSSYIEALAEGFVSGGGKPLTRDEIDSADSNFTDHLKSLDRDGQMGSHYRGRSVPGVPSNTFWLVDGCEMVGSISIRSRIDSDILINLGGHIGYGIRPSKRGQGYGVRQLALGLDIARGMGIGLVRISCAETNDASRRIIETNGGIFLRTIKDHWGSDDAVLMFEIPLV